MTGPRFLTHRGGTASVEFVLMLPVMLALLFGGFEAGHFLWTQHKLVEAVRNGARYASRLEVGSVCDGATAIITPETVGEIKLITRTGQLANAAAVAAVPGWTSAQVSVSVACRGFVDTGIYSAHGGAGPVVTVSANQVPYPSLFGRLSIIDPGITMRARSSAAVIGL